MSTDVGDATGARIIDAALQVLVDNGIRRATVESVARYAGVSHMTIYRRWSNKDELFRAALEFEHKRILSAGYEAAKTKVSFEEKLVAGFAAVLWASIKNPLLTRGLRAEPEEILPDLTVRFGKPLAATVDACAAAITRAAAGSGVEVGDVDAVAEVIVRVAHSLVLTSQSASAFKTRAKVESYARSVMLPVVRAACRPLDTP